MAKQIEVKGTIDRVLRANGKPTKIVITVVETDGVIPLGDVEMSMQSIQSELDLKGSGRVRGDRA